MCAMQEGTETAEGTTSLSPAHTSLILRTWTLQGLLSHPSHGLLTLLQFGKGYRGSQPSLTDSWTVSSLRPSDSKTDLPEGYL